MAGRQGASLRVSHARSRVPMTRASVTSARPRGVDGPKHDRALHGGTFVAEMMRNGAATAWNLECLSIRINCAANFAEIVSVLAGLESVTSAGRP